MMINLYHVDPKPHPVLQILLPAILCFCLKIITINDRNTFVVTVHVQQNRMQWLFILSG